MFFFALSKILAFLFNPLVWLFGVLLWALLTKNSRKRRKLLIIGLVALYFFSNAFVIHELYRWWEPDSKSLSELDEKYDIGVVLGGGMITYDALNQRLTFRHNPDRIMQAIYLYEQKKIDKILISGGSGSLVYRNMKESVLLKEFMVNYMHIPEGDILIDSISDNTYQNALYSKEIIDAHYNNPKVLLITSAFHMRRAKLCFKKQGLSFDYYPTNLIAGPRRFHFDHLFMPHIGSLQMWNSLLHEIFGIVTYKFAGYI